MSENHDPFCKHHNDYIIEVICVDYLTKEYQYLCKKCFKEKNKSITEKKNQEFKEKQQQLQEDLKKEELCLDQYQNEKIKLILEDFETVIGNNLKDIKHSFSYSLNKIYTYQTELDKLDKLHQQQDSEKINEQKQKLEGQINEQKQKLEGQLKEINELRTQSITKNVEKLNQLKNQLIDKVLNLDGFIFSDFVYGQQLYDIPNLNTIFKNFDTNNLLLTFEQYYNLKYQYFRNKDIEQKQNQYENQLKELESENHKIKNNLDEQFQKIREKLDKQKEKMLARFKKYQNWVNQNNDNINKIRKLNQDRENEAQMMQDQEIKNLVNQEITNNKLNNSFEVIRETLSKICHLGFYDIRISLKKIEKDFMVKFIPLTILHDINSMQNNIPMLYPQATSIVTKLNKSGSFHRSATLQDYNGQITIQLQNEQQIGDSIQSFEMKSLFNFDLSEFFPNSQNNFNYTLKKSAQGLESYIEKDDKWQLIQSQEDKTKYNLIINQNEKKIDIKNIQKKQNGEVDETKDVQVVKNKNHQYEGQINNKFQYSGKGKLIENGVIKVGDWKNGELDGIGTIIENGIEQYHGGFLNGKKHGEGREHQTSNLYIKCQFKNDKKFGKCKMLKKMANEFIIIKDDINLDDDVCKLF